MNDFENRLKEYETKCENLETQEFESFEHLEVVYCDLINEGGALRKYLLENPEICDKKTYLVLTNQALPSYINEKYKSLTNVLKLTLELIQKYDEQTKILIDEHKFEEAINIFNQMYNLTKNPVFLYKTIEIHFEKLNDVEKAYELCNSLEHLLKYNPLFHRIYAQILTLKSDEQNAKYHKEYAEELELIKQAKNFAKNKQINEAINTYEKLFELTKNYNYKIEIANIHAVMNSDIDKAISIYKKYKNELNNNANYWWQLSELFEEKDNLYKQVLCIQKAARLETQEMDARETSV